METESNIALYYQYKSLIYRFSEMFPINPIDNLFRQKVTFILESPCEADYERKFKEFFKVPFIIGR